MRRLLLFFSFCMCTCIYSVNTPTPLPITKIIVFGDSLSDTGNVYRFSYHFKNIIMNLPSTKTEFPTGLIPSPFNLPYYNGRFSDGKNWLEDFANLFHITDTEDHHDGALENYAFGGAWASSYGINGKKHILEFPLDLSEQYFEFKLLHPFPFIKSNKVLAIMFIGANDYLATDTSTPIKTQVNRVVNSIIDTMKKIHDKSHISHFLVIGMPDLSQTPYALHLSTYAKTILKNLSEQHNSKLSDALITLQKTSSKIPYHITFINWLNDHHQINSHFSQFHFKYGQSEPCYDYLPYQPPVTFSDKKNDPLFYISHQQYHDLQPYFNPMIPPIPTPVPTRIRNPHYCDDHIASGQHLYMDDVHPTRLAQCIIALRACEKIQSHYLWQDYLGKTHPLNCGIKPGNNDLQQAADQCYTALKAGDLRQDSLLPFEQ